MLKIIFTALFLVSCGSMEGHHLSARAEQNAALKKEEKTQIQTITKVEETNEKTINSQQQDVIQSNENIADLDDVDVIAIDPETSLGAPSF